MRSFLFVLLLLSPLLCAQEFRGTILGRVTDSSSAVVPGVRVRVTNIATGVTTDTKTNTDGNYLTPFLLPGEYEVVAEADGFKRTERRPVRVAVGSRVVVDLALEIGTVAESVTVTSAPPPLNTVNGDLDVTISRQFVERSTANVRRNAIAIAAFSASFTGANLNNQTTDLSNLTVSGGGGRRGVIEYTVDGIPSVNGGGQPLVFIPSVDTVDEIKVQTTMFDAAHGHSNGGSVNITTRGGTNEFHGAGYIYRRWTALNATDWTVNRAGQPKPSDNYRLWGLALSGPVLLPKLYNGRNRTFFTFTLEREKTGFPQSYLSRMPTAAERAGDFSQTINRVGRGLVTIYDPATTFLDAAGNVTRQPFPDARIPAARQSPIGQAVLALLPLPNQANANQLGAYNWARNPSLDFSQKQYTVRIDHQITDANRLFARFSRPKRDQFTEAAFPGELSAGNTAGGLGRLQRNFISGALDDSIIFSPSFVGSIRYGYARSNLPNENSVGLDPAALKLPDIVVANQAFRGWSRFVLGENMPTVGSGRGGQAIDLHSLQVTLTKLWGNHNLKFGPDWRVLRNNNYTIGPASTGMFTLSPAFTQGNPFLAASADVSGTGMASLLLGLAQSGSMGSVTPLSVQRHYLAAYIQDDWKVRPNLTLNFGLRYEVETPFTERYNRITYGFDGDSKLPLQPPGLDLRGGLLFTDTGGLPRRGGKTDKHNFGPRFGFALSLGKTTVLRGGFGVFFSPLSFNNNFLGDSPVFSAITPHVGSTDGATIAATIANPFPNGLQQPLGSSAGLLSNIGNNVTFYDGNRVAPYNQQWQFGVERQLPFGMVLDAAWVGMLSLKQLENFDLNEKPDVYLAQGTAENRAVPNPFFGVFPRNTTLGAGATIPQRQLWLRYPQFTFVSLQGANTGRAVYHSMQANLNKRFSSGLAFQVSYTWSKLMTTHTTSVVNERNYRTIGMIDQPHVFRLSTMYDVPLHPKSRILKALLEGWRLDSFINVESGLPLGISHANGRPVRLRDASIDSPAGERLGDRREGGRVVNPWFDVTAFQPLPNQFTVSPEPPYFPELRAPGLFVLNSGLGKTFAMRERWKIEFRAQAWNLTNSPIFAAPGTNMSNAATFGVITGLRSDGDARRIQGSLRLSF